MTSIDVDAVKAVVLDVGNVILDIDFTRVFAEWARHSGTDIDTIASRFSMEDHYQAHERGEIDAASYLDGLCHYLDIDLSWDGFVAGWEAIIIGPMPGIDEVMAEIADRWTLAWFSNTNELHRRQFATGFAANKAPFDHGFASSDLGARKPEPTAYRAVTEKLGVAPDEIAFFDDAQINVDAARAFGWQAERVDTPAEIAAALELPFSGS